MQDHSITLQLFSAYWVVSKYRALYSGLLIISWISPNEVFLTWYLIIPVSNSSPSQHACHLGMQMRKYPHDSSSSLLIYTLHSSHTEPLDFVKCAIFWDVSETLCMCDCNSHLTVITKTISTDSWCPLANLSLPFPGVILGVIQGATVCTLVSQLYAYLWNIQKNDIYFWPR